MKRRIGSVGFLIAAYLFINTLFIYKYSIRFLPYAGLWTICYPIGAGALFIIFMKDFNLRLEQQANDRLFVCTVILLALILALGMRLFDPAQIRVTRFPALHDWIMRLLNGQYPYTSSARPSGFPFLFLIAVPFYLLGDLGLLQVFAFLIYAYVLHCRFGHGGLNRMRALLLLAFAPIFLYEIAVRSDLFSNMVFVIAFMVYCREKVHHVRIPALLIIGIIGGLLLATRGIVLLIFILYFGFLFKENLRRGIIFAGGLASGFVICCLPFVLWSPEHFIHQGPFAIQTSYVPGWLAVSLVLLCAYLALRARSVSDVYHYITGMLFAAVGLVFVIALFDHGWSTTILGDRFDISYFCFTLPFLLLLYDYGHSVSPRANHVFSATENIA
jgi:hypothetical protein